MDLNGDGQADILSGSYSRMEGKMAGLFQVLWRKEDGKFRKATALTGTDGKPLIIPADDDAGMTQKICTRPTAVDWDGDGDLDLVVGNFAGSFYLFRGEGGGKFGPEPEVIKAGGSALQVSGAHSDPFLVDWDGDGDLDLLSGSGQGGVYWAENVAGKGKEPELEGFEVLVDPPKGNEGMGALTKPGEDQPVPSRATRVWAADVNGDGKLDLLVGDSVSFVRPVKGMAFEECEKRYREWADELMRFGKELSKARIAGEEPDAELMERYHEHHDLRREIVEEEMTGHVWLYLQQ